MILLYISPQYHRVQDSQVITFLTKLANSEYFEKVYLLIGDNKINNRINKNIRMFSFPVFGHYFGLHFLTCFLFNVKLLYIIFQNFRSGIIIHSRTEIPLQYLSVWMLKRMNIRILCDIRGAIDQEVYLFKSLNNFMLKLKEIFIKAAIKKLSNTYIRKTFISPQLKNYYNENHFKIENAFITESMVDDGFLYDIELRNKIRSELGIGQNNILIIYPIGGSESWQNIELMNKIVNPSKYTLLLLTKNKINPQRGLIVKYVDYKDMNGYLSAADYGFLFRDDNIVNQVALPVKSIEYLCAGLPIIRNNSIQYLEQIIDKNYNGHIINSIFDIKKLELKITEDHLREYYSKKYLSFFSTSVIVEKYNKIYQLLLNND